MRRPENALLLWSSICVAAGFATMLVLEVARHLQYLRHRDSGCVPSTQHWCLIASAISSVFLVAGFVLMVMWVGRRCG